MPVQQAKPLDSKDKIARAKKFAKAKGWKGAAGGWIYDENGRAICQGYFALYQRIVRFEASHRDAGAPVPNGVQS